MREVADVHRELFAEQADLYGANVAAKIETCLAVTDGEYEAGRPGPRGVPGTVRRGDRRAST